jgi:glycosyltransferase involved in cell wall biosynthesis
LKNKFIEKYAKRFVSWYYNHCDFVSAPNHSILEEMQANSFKKPCGVLSNPIDVHNFFPISSEEEKEKIKKEFNLSGFIVLYTGRLAAEKHINVLIRAVALAKKKISAIQLAITGHGDSEKSLRKLAGELGLEKDVKFFGTLPTDKHAAIYRAADVFVIASTAEMQSLSMMKAMVTGIPVIGVNAWALPEYIQADNGFVLEPGDYQGIAEKIIFLFENPEKRKVLGSGGWALAQKFSPVKIVREWQAIYEKVRTDYHKNNPNKLA